MGAAQAVFGHQGRDQHHSQCRNHAVRQHGQARGRARDQEPGPERGASESDRNAAGRAERFDDFPLPGRHGRRQETRKASVPDEPGARASIAYALRQRRCRRRKGFQGTEGDGTPRCVCGIASHAPTSVREARR